MESYSQTKKIENIIVLCLLAFVGVVIVAICSIVSVTDARKQVANYDKLINELSAEKQSLEMNITTANSDAYLEEQARGELGMIKDGETIYYFD